MQQCLADKKTLILTDVPRQHRQNHVRREPAAHPDRRQVPPYSPFGVDLYAGDAPIYGARD